MYAPDRNVPMSSERPSTITPHKPYFAHLGIVGDEPKEDLNKARPTQSGKVPASKYRSPIWTLALERKINIHKKGSRNTSNTAFLNGYGFDFSFKDIRFR